MCRCIYVCTCLQLSGCFLQVHPLAVSRLPGSLTWCVGVYVYIRACLHLSGCFLQVHPLWRFQDSAISRHVDLHVRRWSWAGFILWVVFPCCRRCHGGNVVSGETAVATIDPAQWVDSTVFCLHVERTWRTARGGNFGWSPVCRYHLLIDVFASLHG